MGAGECGLVGVGVEKVGRRGRIYLINLQYLQEQLWLSSSLYLLYNVISPLG